MTVEEDGLPSSETTEASNVTSLATDAYSIINSSKVLDVATRQRDDTSIVYFQRKLDEYPSGYTEWSKSRRSNDVGGSRDQFQPERSYTVNERRYEPDKKLAASSAARGGPVTNAGQPTSANHQPQRGPHQLPAQYEPATQCLCHTYRVKQFALPEQYSQQQAERLNGKWPKKEYARRKEKLYEVKVKRNHYRHYSKPQSEEVAAEGIPRKSNPEVDKSEEEPKKYGDARRELEEISERIDIYYFDHGNSALVYIDAVISSIQWYPLKGPLRHDVNILGISQRRYYRTTDSPPILATERCAERTDYAATRFWAEIFGTVHIGVAFVVAFLLQFLRFLLYSIVRPLTVGTLQLLADYFVKPLLSITFNALVQPVLILLYNVATSLRDLCEPIAEALGFFLRELAGLVRAFRLVEVNRVEHRPTGCS